MSELNWPSDTIENCLDKIKLPTKGKVQTSAYKDRGQFPVIDQGQSLISGWVDDKEHVISNVLPVVVFGDHTRVFKFVDFPFVRGADGTQVLKPRSDIHPLYFYFSCLALDLPSRGYNRHFKALKEKKISLPDRDVQEDIGKVLSFVEKANDVQADQLKTATNLKNTSMRELFTRGLMGEEQKETEIGPIPESWDVVPLVELCEILSGGTPRKSRMEFWGGTIPWVSGKDLKVPVLDDAALHLTELGAQSGTRIVPADSVLILVRGMGLAKDLPISVISKPMAFNQDVKALLVRDDYPGLYLRSAIYDAKDRLLSRIVPSAHGTMTLNLDDIETFKVAVPRDPNDAIEIVRTIEAIDAKINLHKRKKAVLEDLFESLLHKLMTGEIRVTDLDLSALKTGVEVAA